MEPKYPIFGLVGPSGSGKSSMIDALIQALPDQVAIMRSLTTRPRRDEQDDRNYEFIDKREMLRRLEEGHLTHLSEYAGNNYSFDRRSLDTLLADKAGVQALVEDCFVPLRKRYRLILVRVEVKGKIDQRSTERQLADEKRLSANYDWHKVIVNDFTDPNGLARASQELIDFAKQTLQQL